MVRENSRLADMRHWRVWIGEMTEAAQDDMVTLKPLNEGGPAIADEKWDRLKVCTNDYDNSRCKPTKEVQLRES
jgi:hypothetical protein